MFESLSDRLSGVFDRLTKQGALSEDDVKTALREVRVALLEWREPAAQARVRDDQVEAALPEHFDEALRLGCAGIGFTIW